MTGGDLEPREPDDESSQALELLALGADFVGGVAGQATGDPMSGAALQPLVAGAINRIGALIYQRLTGPAQQRRAGGALFVARARIRERLESGDKPRDDGFFDEMGGDRAPAEELLEGVLLQAADSYQQRKVQYLGEFYASLVFATGLDPAYAHALLRVADRLTYRQLVLLALIGGPLRTRVSCSPWNLAAVRGDAYAVTSVSGWGAVG